MCIMQEVLQSFQKKPSFLTRKIFLVILRILVVL